MPHPEDNGQILTSVDDIRQYEYQRGYTAAGDVTAEEVAQLRAALATVTAERDAAVSEAQQWENSWTECNGLYKILNANHEKLKADFAAHLALPAPAGHSTTPPPDPEPEPEPEPTSFPLVPALALNPKDDTNYNSLKSLGLDSGWILRAYHGGAFKPLDQFSWFNWMKSRFAGLVFSTAPGTSTASYQAVANGDHDDMFRRIIDSWPDGKFGGINLGNEMNLEPTTPAAFKAAIEHLIDTFELPPNVYWTLAYSNWKSWTNSGRQQHPGNKGELYLPDRPNKRILVLTHTYGKSEWPNPVDQQSMFHQWMDRYPNWLRGGGEASCQEDPNNRDRKANYLVGAAEAMEDKGGCMFTLFDSGTNGSDEIASTAHTAARIKTWADTHNDNWS